MKRRELLGLVAGSSSLLVPGAANANPTTDTGEDTPDAGEDSDTVTIGVKVVSS